MKLYWGPLSPFVRKVMIAAHETGQADRIELVRTLVAMDRVHPEVIQDNPLSKIPTLVTDDGMVLFDSDVICEYLDSLHAGPKLVPPEGPARWQVLRWNALGSGMLDALVLWRNERMRPEGGRSAATLLAYGQKCQATLDRVEQDVGALAARPFGLGHIAIGCMFGYLDLRFPDVAWRDGRPASTRWHDEFSQRPSARCTLAAVADALVPPAASSAHSPSP